MGHSIDWAENEIKIVCEKHKNDDENDFDYANACYQSALKAFKSLLEDGHSGMSIGFTKNIFNRLIEFKPLSPLTGADEEWAEPYSDPSYRQRLIMQNKRYPSLFKYVDADNNISYHDVDRAIVVDEISETSWQNGMISRYVDSLYPIEFPYYPGKPYVMTVQEFCYENPDNTGCGEYDTFAWLYLTLPDGTKRSVDKYFTEVGGKLREIDCEEYLDLKKNHDFYLDTKE